MAAATASVNGYLTSADWTTFNNKGSGTVTSVTGTSPVVSSGGTTPAISMAAATTSVSGYLTSTDWTTFNNKGSGTVTSVAAITLGTAGTDLTSTVATGTTTPVITLNVPTASASNRGALSSADWTTFNNKGSGTVTSVTGTAPVVSSGGATPAISMAAATTSVNGYLTSTDWTTFNNKGSGTVTSVSGSGGTTGLTLTGGAITTTGTLTLGGTLAVANGGTGITSFGTGIATFLGTPTSANLAAAVTDETGSGLLVFGTQPIFTNNLTVSGTQVGKLYLNSTSSGSWKSAILFQNSGASKWEVGTDVSANGTNDLYFYDSVAGANRLFISSAGNVGIGTSSPTASLQVPGNSTTIAAIFTNVAEPTTVSATAATGTIALYPSTQSILYYTSNASANWTTNITFSSGTTMNTAMSTGQTMTVTFWVTQGATAYYNNLVWVDGAVTGVTTKWLGGAPTAGNASGIDVYTYSVTKTGSATFTVLATVAQFK
jgi:hypothetical protein